LLDIWGVLHDGRRCYPGAIDCLQQLKSIDKPVILLSNAARRIERTRQELSTLGIAPHLYCQLITSGEMTWQALKSGGLSLPNEQPGYYLGPERSRSICYDLNIGWTDSLQKAGFVLNTGVPEGNLAAIDSLLPLLESMLAENLPMICANPDQMAIRAGIPGISAGAIARRYQAMGAEKLIWFGKPETQIFESALGHLDGIDRSRVLMIGDGYETDIRGANDSGIASLLISGGIHHGDLPILNDHSIARLNQRFNVQPDYYCELFQW
jgi:HAD superfamily hydrolase (TIGR01459 family)